MKDIFRQWFYQACCESSSRAVVRHAESDPEYQAISQRSAELCNDIKERLGEDSRHLIFRFEDSENQKGGLREEWIYQQAFRDCFYLLQWMDAIRQA